MSSMRRAPMFRIAKHRRVKFSAAAQFTKLQAFPPLTGIGLSALHDKVSPHRTWRTTLLEIIKAAGWPIYFIILSSVLALAIIVERFWSLRRTFIAPDNLFAEVVQVVRGQGVNADFLERLAANSLLGRVFAAGLYNLKSTREVMKDAVEDAGTTAVLELERFLNTLGTIATVTPLLGLFGTVVGMIEIFGSQAPGGGNPAQLAQGISIALYNTGAGLAVAIPSLVFYRHFRKKVDILIVEMEQQAVKLVEVVHGERRA
jgi:biopolymer transport protein ExbB